MKKIKLNSIVIALTVLIPLHSCNNEKKVKTDSETVEIIPDDIVEMRADQIKLANIETRIISMHPLSVTLQVNGMVVVAPQNLATVCAPLGGFVVSTSLMPGNAVSQGQTLAMIENQEFIDIQQSYLETKNKFEFMEAEFKRHTELFKDDVYSKQNLQQVTVDYKGLKSQVKALEQKLALIGINPADLNEDNINRSVPVKSPIKGYIKTVNVNTGKFVSPTDVMFEIVNSDRLLLELTLFEKDAGTVTENQKVRFFINNETELHDAVIYQTTKSVSADKTYKVYANVTSVCRNVLPGMYVRAVIATSDRLVPSVPNEAVVSFGDKDYIFVFEKNKVEDEKPFTEYRMIEVKKGVSDSGYTEVILPEDFDIQNAQVVTIGAYNLLSAKKNAGEMAC